MNITKRPHPSNKLYSNEVDGFIEAMQTYQRMMDHEKHLFDMSNETLTADDTRMLQVFKECVRKAGEAMEIYQLHQEAAAEATIKELRAKQDEDFDAFADALECDDYSDLAI